MDKDGDQPGQICLFEEAERALNMKIPETLQNILIINGFVNEVLLANFSNEDFINIQNFCRSNLIDIIERHNLHKYLGPYNKNPEKFVIVSGHRKIVNMISEYFKQKTANAKKNIPKTDTKTVNMKKSTDSPTKRDANMPQESEIILKRIHNWAKEHMEENIFASMEEKLLTISLKLNSCETACTITCFCEATYTIPKLGRTPTASKRWIYSNFHTHLKKHALIYKNKFEALKKSPHRNNEKKSSKNLLTNYFAPLGEDYDTNRSNAVIEKNPENKGKFQEKCRLMPCLKQIRRLKYRSHKR